MSIKRKKLGPKPRHMLYPDCVNPSSRLEISENQLRDSLRRYYLTNNDRERYGQWLCNKYLKEGVLFPELYYERHSFNAQALAMAEVQRT